MHLDIEISSRAVFLVCGRTKDHVENLLVAWLMASLECSFVVIAALSLPWGFINA